MKILACSHESIYQHSQPTCLALCTVSCKGTMNAYGQKYPYYLKVTLKNGLLVPCCLFIPTHEQSSKFTF